jgi:hypothetical protein
LARFTRQEDKALLPGDWRPAGYHFEAAKSHPQAHLWEEDEGHRWCGCAI